MVCEYFSNALIFISAMTFSWSQWKNELRWREKKYELNMDWIYFLLSKLWRGFDFGLLNLKDKIKIEVKIDFWEVFSNLKRI